jgi:hypothetical protein
VSLDGEVSGPRTRSGVSRRLLVGALAATAAFGIVVATAAALATATLTDAVNDTNAAPDIVSVTVDDSVANRMKVRVQLDNMQVLPASSRINVQFDLDRNTNTGVAGDELVVRYTDAGAVEVLRWDGIRLSPSGTDGIAASLAAGTLELDFALAALGGSTAFTLRASAQRTQDIGGARVTATDFAPTAGRSVYLAPGHATFPDPRGDHDAAPDIKSVTISDTAAGMVMIRIEIANYTTFGNDKVVGIGFDLAGRPASADDVFAAFYSGPNRTEVDWEEGGNLAPSPLTNRSTSSFADGVLTMSIPRAELDSASSFGFSALSLDVVGDGEAVDGQFEGEVEALDTAPDDISGRLPSYKLAHPGPLKLRKEAFGATPFRPKANRRFVWSMLVRRMDTYKLLRSGAVTCSATASGKRVKSTGRFVGRRAQCSALVPTKTRAKVLRGTIGVRAGGKTVRERFSAVIR